MVERLRIKVYLTPEARGDIDRLNQRAKKRPHGQDAALLKATMVMLKGLDGRRHPTKPLEFDPHFADLSDCDTTYVGADPNQKPPLRIVSRDIPPSRPGGITRREIVAIGPRRDSQVYRTAGVRLDRRMGVTLEALDAQREAATQRARPSDRVSSTMLDHHPESYDRLRETFDQDLARLGQIVGGWNPDNPAVKPRVELWEKHIASFDQFVADIDEMVEDKPENAQSTLTQLSSKLGMALDRLDPQRKKAAGPSVIPQFSAESDRRPGPAEDEYQPGS